MSGEQKEEEEEEEESFSQFADRLRAAHATEIGLVAIAWNRLQAELLSIFAPLVSPSDLRVARAVWNAIKNDRMQRDMLLAAAAEVTAEGSRFYDDLKWALGQLDALENDRNNVLHSPYSLTIDGGEIKFVPYHFEGHPRARALMGKDLSLELKSIEDRLQLLTAFLHHLAAHRAAKEDAGTWPTRPPLRAPAHANAPRAARR